MLANPGLQQGPVCNPTMNKLDKQAEYTGNTIQISQVSNSMHTIALAENKNKCGGK